jgi:small conductance mechanosensitive channel
MHLRPAALCAALCLLAAALAPAPAAAQFSGLLGGQSQASGEEAGGQESGGQDSGGQEAGARQPAPETLCALAEALQNPETRQALIDELLRAAEASGATGPSESGAASETAGGGEASGGSAAAGGQGGEAAATQETTGFAREIAETTTGIAEEALALGRRLAIAVKGLAEVVTGEREVDWVDLGNTLIDLAIVAAATLVAWWLVGRVARRLFEAAARKAVDRGWTRRILLLIGTGIIDALVILLAWGGGYGLALSLGEGGQVGIIQGLFLNAFLLIELVKVVLRLALAPSHSELRLLPIADRDAAYWYFWLSRLVGFLGYGFMLAVPVVQANISWAAGRGLRVLIALAGTVLAVALILGNRRSVRQGLRAQARRLRGEVATRALNLFAGVWHVLALVYVVTLFAIWLARPYEALGFMLGATAESIVAILVGLLAASALTQLISGGVRLPDSLRQKLPLLESRLNAFVPNVLKGVRLLVMLGVILAILDSWTLISLGDWLSSETGTALLGSLVGALVILGIALLLWVAVISWIEYRMNPDLGVAPSPRVRTLLALFRNAFTVTLLVVAAMLALSELGVDIGPLLAGAGVVGLAVGFGAQKLVQDIITGAFIQFENAMNEGEVVTVAGISGVVERLTVRSVGLRDLSGVYHLIPFSSVDSVSNFMKGFSYHLAAIGVAYREDIGEVKQAMLDAFEELKANEEHGPSILEPFEMHGVTEFGDSAIVVRGRIKTRPGDQWALGRAYNEIIKRIFDERGIEIPFPHVTLYMGEGKDGSAPPLHLRAEEVEQLTDRARTQHDASAEEPGAPQEGHGAPATETSEEVAEAEKRAPRMPERDEGPDGADR